MTAVAEPLAVHEPPQRRGARFIVSHPKVLAGITILVLFLILAVIQPLLEVTIWARNPQMYDPQFGFDSSITHPSAPSTTANGPPGTGARARPKRGAPRISKPRPSAMVPTSSWKSGSVRYRSRRVA